jgi:D-xylose transport system substrate-binding protein
MAGGIVTVLKNNKLAGKVPVTGQDASDEGLQRVIAGTQCGSVFKDVNLEG